MGDGAGLTTVRTELKGVQSSLPGERQTMLPFRLFFTEVHNKFPKSLQKKLYLFPSARDGVCSWKLAAWARCHVFILTFFCQPLQHLYIYFYLVSIQDLLQMPDMFFGSQCGNFCHAFVTSRPGVHWKLVSWIYPECFVSCAGMHDLLAKVV